MSDFQRLSVNQKTVESRLRRLAKKSGFCIHKSRARNTSIDDMGGYMVMDTSGYIHEGHRFQLTLEDIKEILEFAS